MSMDVSELSIGLDNALVDPNSATVSVASELDASFTSFEEILRHDSSRIWRPSESVHSRADSTSELLWESQAFLMRSTKQVNDYSEDARTKGEEYANAAHSEAGKCVVSAKENVNELLKDFFSSEQKEARAQIADNTVTMLCVGLASCHDNVDTFLLKIFDQPLHEVEVNQTDSMTVDDETITDELTIDSDLTKRAIDASMSQSTSKEDDGTIFLVPSNSLSMEGFNITGDDKKNEGPSISAAHLDHEDQTTQDLLNPSTSDLGLQSVLTTESDAASLLRFKEELYNGYGAKRVAPHPTPDAQEESRTGPEILTSTSMEEFDQALRMDMQKLDRGAGRASAIETIERVDTSTDTPLRGNRRTYREAEFVDLSEVGHQDGSSHYYQQQGIEDATMSRILRHGGAKVSCSAVAPRAVIDPFHMSEPINCIEEMEGRDAEQELYRHYDAALADPVIDLTMYQ